MINREIEIIILINKYEFKQPYTVSIVVCSLICDKRITDHNILTYTHEVGKDWRRVYYGCDNNPIDILGYSENLERTK